MASAITAISSMATKHILAEAARSYSKATGISVVATAAGGVDVARRLRAGEKIDVVVLARGALDRLAADGIIDASSIIDIARSLTAIAVKRGAPRPADCSEAEIKELVTRAGIISLSTGPSGVSVRKLLQSWDLGAVAARVVEAPPGIPVAQLVSTGEADIGFQQLSELLGQPGIDISGVVPETLLPATVFSAAIGATDDVATAHALVSFLGSPTMDAIKTRHGMKPVYHFKTDE